MKTKKVGTKWGIKRFVAWMLIFMMVVSLMPQGYLSANAAEVSEAEEVSDELEADEASGEEADTEEDEESLDMADEADEASEEAVDEGDAVSDDAAESELEEEAAAEEEIEEPAEEVLEETEEGVEEKVETEEESTEVEAEEETAEEEVAEEVAEEVSEEETEEAVSEEVVEEEAEGEAAEAEVVVEEANTLNVGECTVVFNAKGGKFSDETETQSVSVGIDEEVYFSEHQPTRKDYELWGWSTFDSGYPEYYIDDDDYVIPSWRIEEGETLTLYAVWVPVLTLNANGGAFTGGSDAVNIKVEYGYTDLDDYEPVRSGYTLLGWSKSAGAASAEYNGTIEVSSPMTLYAVWEKAIVITLDANGGLFPNNEKILNVEPYYGEVYLGSYNRRPTKSGYTLLGWSKNAKATSAEYDVYDDISVSASMTLYAIWKKAITIKLDANGGAFTGGASTKDITVDSDGWVYLSESNRPTRNGYVLKGWATSKSGSTEYRSYISNEFTKDTTLYAIWAQEVTITLNANGGTFPEDAWVSVDGTFELSKDKKTITAKVAKGTSVYVSDEPTKSNTALRGWGTSAKATEPVAGSTRNLNVTADATKTYYAIWASGYTVTFKAAGTLCFRTDGKETDTVTALVAKGDSLYNYAPIVYVKTTSGGSTSYNSISKSYTKWGTSKSTKVANAFFAENYRVAAKATLYAVNAQTVKTTWNANGGKIDGESKIVETDTYGRRVSSYSEPTHASKTFVGWSTTKKASGLVDFSNPIYALKNATYYAIWESGYKITIKAPSGGRITYCYRGTLSSDSTTATFYIRKGESISSISFEAIKDGKVLEGLSTTANGKAIINRWSYRPSGNMTLYAVSASYEITFNANGGTFSDGETVAKSTIAAGYGVGYSSPTRKGYEFVGWYTKKSGGSVVNMATKSMTVYAHWKKALTVTWNANGGSLSSRDYVTTEVSYVTKNTLLKNYYRKAYSPANNKGFAGWSKSKKGSVINLDTFKVTKNLTLYAIWESGDDLADGRIVLSKNRYVYTGKAIKPSFTVYDRNGKKVASSQYKATITDNNGAGTGHILIRGKGKKGGTLRANFDINYEARSNVSSAKASKKSIKVSFKKAAGAAKYYVYAYNTTTGAVYSTDTTTTSATIKKVAKGTYKVYVIPAAKMGGVNDGFYSSDRGAGTIKSVKVK